jgi:hypothetical protein
VLLEISNLYQYWAFSFVFGSIEWKGAFVSLLR